MGEVSRLQMNLDETLAWDYESTSYADLRRCNNNLRLLDHWCCNNDLRWWLDNRRCNNDLRGRDHWFLYTNLYPSKRRNFYANLRHLDLGCLHDNLGLLHDNLWSTMSVMEFRFEMNTSCWLSIEVNLYPFFPRTVLSKNRQWHIGLANKWRREGIFVAYSDMHALREQICFDLHELECPIRVFAAVLAYCRSPLLLTNTNDHEWVHFVEGTAEVAL